MASFFKFQTKFFISYFKNGNIQIFSFQFSGMKVFQFFIANFKNKNFQSFHFKFFHYKFSLHTFSFPSGGMPNFFKFQNHFFFNFFHFPLMVWPVSFQNSKTKKFIPNFKSYFFSKFFISNFPYGINEFFLSPRLPNLLKDCKITYLSLCGFAFVVSAFTGLNTNALFCQRIYTSKH
jgi:hypothetical protein